MGFLMAIRCLFRNSKKKKHITAIVALVLKSEHRQGLLERSSALIW
jgi:hypothetical protein